MNLIAAPSAGLGADNPGGEKKSTLYDSAPLLLSIVLHAALIALLLFLRFRPDATFETQKPIAITYLPGVMPDSPAIATVPQARSDSQAAQAAQGSQAAAAVAPAAPMEYTPSIPISPFTPATQAPMQVIRPKAEAAPPPTLSPPMPQAGATTGQPAPPGMGAGTMPATGGNGLSGFGALPGSGLGPGGNGLGSGNGGGGGGASGGTGAGHVHFLVVEIDGLRSQRMAMAGLNDFSNRLIRQCGLTAVHSEHQNWVVEIRITFAPNGAISSLVPINPPGTPSQDYQSALGRLMAALTNPACGYLSLPPQEQRVGHSGEIYLYPMGGGTPADVPEVRFPDFNN